MKVNKKLMKSGRQMWPICKEKHVSREDFGRAAVTQYELHETSLGSMKALAGLASLVVCGFAASIIPASPEEKIAATIIATGIPALVTGMYFDRRYINVSNY